MSQAIGPATPDMARFALLRNALADFAPMLGRAVDIDSAAMFRTRTAPGRVSGFVRLPFDFLAGRTVSADVEAAFDLTVSAAQMLSWLHETAEQPRRRDHDWLAPLPPAGGWRRIESVPDAEIRPLVRSGALLARSASSRTEQGALLDGTVLRVSAGVERVDVPLGSLSALTRMGFLPKGGDVMVDVAGGWIRTAAAFGSTYAARADSPLQLLTGRP
jgi:hypothetical protein